MYSKLSFVLILSVACAGSKTGTSTSVTYYENLANWRPKTHAASTFTEGDSVVNNKKLAYPEYDMTEEIDSVIRFFAKENKEIKFTQGLTIQVYSGTSREEAYVIQTRINDMFSDLEPFLEYRTPSFKVKVGQYYDRLEAQKGFVMLRKIFPDAVLVPERIYINQE